MNEHSRETLDAYYEDAASWNSDRLEAVNGSRRIAWIVASVAGAIALLEAGALLLLTPLKTVEPYTLLVDKTTGYVQPLKPLDPAAAAPDAALTQSYLVQYVIARESFDYATVRNNYRRVALFSAGIARSGYLATMQPSNPQNPLTLYPRGTEVETRVKSVSPVGPDAALVRFDTVKSGPNGGAEPARAWVALVRYRYSNAPMTLEDRFVNPLGFQIFEYRRDPETIAPAQPAGQPAYPQASASAASQLSGIASPGPSPMSGRAQ